MLHAENSERFGDFLQGTDFIQLNYCIFLLKLRPFKNYSSTFHIIAKHVDIHIVVGDTKCAISIIVLLFRRDCVTLLRLHYVAL